MNNNCSKNYTRIYKNYQINYKRKKLSMNILQLAKRLYEGRDSSHGIIHVKKVRDNALMLCEKLNITDRLTLIKVETSALFHDLWDHKYINQFSYDYIDIKEELYNELSQRYYSDHDIKDIEIIIDNISLTREMLLRKEGKTLELKHLQLMRDIVSDADKLEMLGMNGIDRIIDFQLFKYPSTKTEELRQIVKDIYNVKISKLIKEKYIRTEPARELAEPLMREMEEYIKKLD